MSLIKFWLLKSVIKAHYGQQDINSRNKCTNISNYLWTGINAIGGEAQGDGKKALITYEPRFITLISCNIDRQNRPVQARYNYGDFGQHRSCEEAVGDVTFSHRGLGQQMLSPHAALETSEQSCSRLQDWR